MCCFVRRSGCAEAHDSRVVAGAALLLQAGQAGRPPRHQHPHLARLGSGPYMPHLCPVCLYIRPPVTFCCLSCAALRSAAGKSAARMCVQPLVLRWGGTAEVQTSVAEHRALLFFPDMRACCASRRPPPSTITAGSTGSCRRWTTCCSAARRCCPCTPTCPQPAGCGAEVPTDLVIGLLQTDSSA